jgi:hypothetical protein
LSRFFYIPHVPLFGANFASVPRVLIHEAVRMDLA